MARDVEPRPPPFQFAAARKFKAEEYAPDDLKKLSTQLFKTMPRSD